MLWSQSSQWQDCGLELRSYAIASLTPSDIGGRFTIWKTWNFWRVDKYVEDNIDHSPPLHTWFQKSLPQSQLHMESVAW